MISNELYFGQGIASLIVLLEYFFLIFGASLKTPFYSTYRIQRVGEYIHKHFGKGEEFDCIAGAMFFVWMFVCYGVCAIVRLLAYNGLIEISCAEHGLPISQMGAIEWMLMILQSIMWLIIYHAMLWHVRNK